MGLLTSGTQVRPAVVHAIVELLVASNRPISIDELEQLLQPAAIEDLAGNKPPEGAVRLTASLCVELGLVEEESGALVPDAEIGALELPSLNRLLPAIVRDRMLAPKSQRGEEARECDDLVLALGWFMAQDSWNPCRTVDGKGDSWEARLAAQVPEGVVSLNTTKTPQIFSWGEYLGLGAPDPVERETWIPDPTRLLRRTLGSMELVRAPLVDVIVELASRFAVLDNGEFRRAALAGLAPGELPWEGDSDVLSPSISLALRRLAHAKEIELLVLADSPRRCRLSIANGEESLVDVISLIQLGGAQS